ncbi:hypothetical protein DXA15_13000 [Parabacteroides sp. AM58-2XD]|uniref:NVEALA domain-containing protein n=1 Tax=Parabacteroides TaxID=375288 RepID=UPI000FE20437|nr:MULTISPECIES: NVEALA domain-containing protein [Parabacteroides]RGY96434.1 hypothetical protein DXA15_13000 [Parabacteroides sp. AM58-2XD]GKG75597.1 hypothetical protein CE91St1_47400 [Parabacteroides goldsteinii]GKG80996.1 hypothetical protein CE91St2_41880 [Parabacteroides goldsteinii]
MNAKLKVVMSLVTLVGVAILNGYQFSQQSGIVNSSSLMKKNLEALASGELGKGFYKNFKSATVWYNSDVSGGLAVSEKPSVFVSGNWKSMICCVNGTDMDACNFLLENSECARRVVRNSYDE